MTVNNDFFNVNSLDIIRSSLTSPSSFIIKFDKVYSENFLVWNIYFIFLFHF